MRFSASILIYGRDQVLVETRRMVLQHMGYDITVADDLEHVRELLASRSFDLLILCHSLSVPECEAAVQECQRLSSKTRRLILGSAMTRCAELKQDAQLTGFAAPEVLMARVTDLTARPHPTVRRDDGFRGHNA